MPNPDELADSFAVLATWTDLVVVVVDRQIDAEGSLAPVLAIDDMVNILGLPVVVACKSDENADFRVKAEAMCCCERGIPVIGCIVAGDPVDCGLSAPCLGHIPIEELHDPLRASRRINAHHLLGVLGLVAGAQNQARH